tara:strand:- start:1017 stop:1652 length:636 start_codon:yes stop_codon:yes gene_type:complete
MEATNEGVDATPSDEGVDAALLSEVRAQVEFYFGDTNLPTDKFLLKQIKKSGAAEGWCAIGVVTSFPKMKKMMPGWKKGRMVALVVEALEPSTLLSVDDAGKRLRRTEGVPEEWMDLEERRKRSVVVTNLAPSATIAQVEEAFAKHGAIVLVKIETQPFHSSTVEFAAVESARAAVAAHRGDGGWRRGPGELFCVCFHTRMTEYLTNLMIY